jgi:hypothetical protein
VIKPFPKGTDPRRDELMGWGVTSTTLLSVSGITS